MPVEERRSSNDPDWMFGLIGVNLLQGLMYLTGKDREIIVFEDTIINEVRRNVILVGQWLSAPLIFQFYSSYLIILVDEVMPIQ